MILPDWYLRHFLRIDPLVCALASAACYLHVRTNAGEHCLDAVLDGQRGQVYGALAGIFGSLLGFVIAAEAIVVQGSARNARLRSVASGPSGVTLRGLFHSTSKGLLLGLVLCLLALPLDREQHKSYWLACSVLGVVGFALLRMAHVVATMHYVAGMLASGPGPAGSDNKPKA